MSGTVSEYFSKIKTRSKAGGKFNVNQNKVNQQAVINIKKVVKWNKKKLV